jgi:hypothetical protein
MVGPTIGTGDVVTAGSICFVGELRDKYPQHFGILSEARAQALEFAIANNVLEGWEPNEDDIRDLCEATAGHLSQDEVLKRGLDRLHWLRPPPSKPDRSVC